MKTIKKIALAAVGLLIGPAVFAANNVWTNAASGKWETAANWSLGAPFFTDSIYITNANSKTVTIDATTAGSYSGTLAVSNLWIAAPTGSTNKLQLLGTGDVPLYVFNDLMIASGGSMVVSNSVWGIQNSLTVSNGSLVILRDLEEIVGFTNFHFTVTGPSAVSSNSGAVLIADGSSNNVLVTNGARVDIGDFYLGFDGFPEQFDTVTVTGTNSQMNVGVFSLGESGSSNHVYISNGGTVRIAGILTMSSDPASQGNSITLLPGGTLNVGNSVYVANSSGAQASFQVSGGVTVMSSNLVSGGFPGSSGAVSVSDGGTLNVTNANATFSIGNNGATTNSSGTGVATVSNATVNATTISLGSTAGGVGTLTLQSNALVNIASKLTVVSGSLSLTSSVALNGGVLNLTNGTLSVGSSGSGQVTITGGSHTIRNVQLGSTNGVGAGSLHLSGGKLKILGNGSVNFILVDGGDLDGSGGTVTIGENHDATMVVSSGTTKAGTMLVGYSPGFTGTYTQSGGTVNVFTNLVVGDCLTGALGVAMFSGGIMYVTNAAHTAVLDVRNGTFTLNTGATLVVDTLVVTNGCGHFLKQGGMLIENNPRNLSPNLDADGDGQSNAGELAAGTDPLDALSLFQMTSATVSNQDVRVYWTTVGGRSYIVQTNGNLSQGGFHDLNASTPVVFPGTAAGVTNYLHQNGATNGARFYRVRLGP